MTTRTASWCAASMFSSTPRAACLEIDSIRFGRVAHETILDRNRRVVSFIPGSTFAFVRWASNDFGTIISRIDIVLLAIAITAFYCLAGLALVSRWSIWLPGVLPLSATWLVAGTSIAPLLRHPRRARLVNATLAVGLVGATALAVLR